MRSPAVPPSSRPCNIALYSSGAVGANVTLMFGFAASKAGMIVSSQTARSSLRQLSMTSSTVSPLAAVVVVSPPATVVSAPAAVVSDESSLLQAAAMSRMATIAIIHLNLRFILFLSDPDLPGLQRNTVGSWSGSSTWPMACPPDLLWLVIKLSVPLDRRQVAQPFPALDRTPTLFVCLLNI